MADSLTALLKNIKPFGKYDDSLRKGMRMTVKHTAHHEK
ncbi:Uncharacterised protein [Legionella quinlivanii]|nr:Uncharacterised protein [Legionella quinlivanii]